MIEARIVRQVVERAGRSGLRVVAAEDDPFQAGEDDGAHAHGTGFEGYVQGGAKRPQFAAFFAALRMAVISAWEVGSRLFSRRL